MANYLFKENPRRKGRRLPPKEWFYYMVERVKKNLHKRGFRPRPDSPHRTIPQVAKAITGGMWWGTFDGISPTMKRKILKEVISNRAKGKVAVVTGRKGSISKAAVKRAIGETAAKRLYNKLELTKTEIDEARQLLKRGMPAIERARRRVAANPELLIITGNPGVDLMDKKKPPTLADFKKAYPELWKKALKMHRRFHGVDPETVQLQWVESDVPPIMVKMGDAPDVTYHVKGNSRKQKKIPFKHDYKGKVHVCTDINGKAIFHIPDAKKGRNVRVSDWVRG